MSCKPLSAQKLRTRSGPNLTTLRPRAFGWIPSSSSRSVGSDQSTSDRSRASASGSTPRTWRLTRAGRGSSRSCESEVRLAPSPPCTAKMEPSIRAPTGINSNTELSARQTETPAWQRRSHSARNP
eukprot:scaffold8942_cov99-Isochrysis_galbana.AAC.2